MSRDCPMPNAQHLRKKITGLPDKILKRTSRVAAGVRVKENDGTSSTTANVSVRQNVD
jgi:hypothetical protein